MNRLIINLGNTHIRFGVFPYPSPSSPILTPPIIDLNIPNRTPEGTPLSLTKILDNYRKKILPKIKSLFNNKNERYSSNLPIIMVSVTPSRNKPLIKEIETSLDSQVVLLTHDLLPSIPYSPAQGMGLDRLIKILAAGRLYPHEKILILDFGTALTIDAVVPKALYIDRSNIQYLGGMIMPGFTLSLKTLHHYTEKLPYLVPSPSPEFLAHSTTACMTGGTFHFYIQALMGIIEKIKTDSFKGKEFFLLLTGGDAGYFKSYLASSLTNQKITLIDNFNLIAANLLTDQLNQKEAKHV